MDGFINYVSLIYCTFGKVSSQELCRCLCANVAPLSQELFPLTILLFLLWVVVLFIALAVSADDYFCPSVEVMSRLLRSATPPSYLPSI